MLEILAAVRSLGLSLSGIALLALFGGACTRNPPSSGDAPATARLTEPPASASALRPQPVPETPADWVEAARMERWDEVARRIDALDPEDRQKPGTRYVRARAAAELGQHAESVKLLAGLEKELPLLAADIERYRAEAELEAGPFEQAARYFAQGRAPSSLVKAALAFERAGQLEQARAASDRALGALAKLASKNQSSDPAPEARARAVRARVSEKQGQIALAASDLRWITTFAPTLPEADGLDEHLERLSPPHALSKRERFQRAIDMAEHGFVEQTERELELIAKAKGQEPKPAELLRTRGWALFKARRDYARAAELLEQAAKLGSSDVARDLFYAARARSRAQEDERAIGMYEALVRRFPNTSWAEHASFLAARLRYLLGRWDEATPAYQRFLARHGKGQYGGTARYEQAVSWLAAKNYDKAMKAFSELAREENDEREQARALELEGVALAGAGKKDAAIARFRRVIREQPLSFPALASATRLAELGEPAGPPIEPGKLQTSAPLEPALPARAAQLVSLGLDRDAEQELVYSSEALRKRYAPRGDEALCRAHGQLATAAERYRIGQQAARFLDLRSAPTPSTRWLWDCIYPRPYESVVRQTETEWNLPTDFVYAVMRQESAFKSNAVSPAAAIGLMQLLEPTGKQVASELGVTATNGFLSSPPQNIRFGAYYLKKLLDAFGGQLPLAAAAYNAGPLAVNRWLETGETLPLDLWVARIPYEETRTYVARVLGNYARYAYLAGGEAALPKLALELPKGLRAPPNAY